MPVAPLSPSVPLMQDLAVPVCPTVEKEVLPQNLANSLSMRPFCLSYPLQLKATVTWKG